MRRRTLRRNRSQVTNAQRVRFAARPIESSQPGVHRLHFVVIVERAQEGLDLIEFCAFDADRVGKPIPFHEIKGFLLGRLAARQRITA